MSFFHRSGKSDAARGTPGQPQHPELPRCAFCLKEQKDVRMLIAGPSVHICDACVGACVEIIAEDDDGNEFAMHVVEVHDDVVVVDTNHPLAGYTLVWDVTVREVRDATQAEIDRARADAAELDVSPDGTD